MAYAVNAAVAGVEAPPIAEAMGWVRPNRRNRPLLNLCQAVPSYPPAEELQQEMARAALDAATGLYTDILGLPALRTALADHMAEDYGGSVASGNVAIAAGCNQAFCVAMTVLARAGDNVVLPVPYYFNHRMWLTVLGIEARLVPAFGENRPWPDVSEAAAAIDGRTRAIVLCTPNNPTGAVYPPEVVAAFCDLAKSKALALVIDETYKDFRPAPATPHDLFARPDWQDTFVQLYSFSKVFAMTGYRCGSIAAGSAFIAEAEKVLDCVAICAPHIAQRAALFGLTHLGAWKARKRATMLDRTTALRAAFASPGLDYEAISAGAYFAYVRHPFRGTPARDVAQKLAAEHDLLCLPGSMFGPGQEDFLRIAFANAEAELMPLVADRLLESQR